MTTETASHPTGLMDLPVEIRLEIYHYLFHLPAFYKYTRSNDSSTVVHAGLLLANRQINEEATPMLYSENTFLAHPNLLASFPRLRARYSPVKEASVLPRIRRFHVEIRLDTDLPYDQPTVTKAFSGMDELSINVIQSMYLGVGHRNLHKFEGIRGVKRAHITGSTTGFEEYAKWLEGVMQSEPGTQFDEFKPSHWCWSDRLANIHY
ncbi:hypothetical protein B0J13DRAFT_263709 [Dactylonectria estremocensis]|uniref:F-box domain-containing protein n=1 Tax=Dactylonectria estremocensis TaxID=1079267 RepID=A0A9P9JBB4_9HYPO|nr:hypothetical protein B0J13DRAFT_263709 [Dactylonectria estremocensis]